jgi:hypothetical protein
MKEHCERAEGQITERTWRLKVEKMASTAKERSDSLQDDEATDHANIGSDLVGPHVYPANIPMIGHTVHRRG